MLPNEGALYKRITSTTSVKVGQGRICGFIVSSHSSGTIRLLDNADGLGGGHLIMNTTALSATEALPIVRTFEPINFRDGLEVTVGGTADITILYD